MATTICSIKYTVVKRFNNYTDLSLSFLNQPRGPEPQGAGISEQLVACHGQAEN